jgi:ABC-2 type transport system ATP-binding protein
MLRSTSEMASGSRMAGGPRNGGGSMIEVEGVRKSFGTTVALAGVDLSAEAGRVLALLGPNGAGKTTLVRILTTLLAPDSGQASVGGYDTVRDAATVRSVTGLTGQYAAVDELLTGRENLEMIGEFYHLGRGEARLRAGASLEEFGLAEAADRPASTYSGGMRRRLDLAASLIGRPPVLILDEPTTGLDPRTRIDLWVTIEKLVAAGTTLLLTTQYLEEADRLAHRIVIIDRGSIIAAGTADQLKAELGGDVIELRVAQPGDVEKAADALERLADGGLLVDRARQRITVPAPNGATTLAAALVRLHDASLTIDDIGIRRPSLDEVFLALTGHAADDEQPLADGDAATVGPSPNNASTNSRRTTR